MKARPLVKRLVHGMSIFLALYTMFGFFLLPRIITQYLSSTIAEKLGLKATITMVRVNPYTLSVSFHGFSIQDKDGSTLASCDACSFNAQASSIVRRAAILKEVTCRALRIGLKIRPDGSLDLADVFSFGNNEPQATTNGSLPRISINRVSLYSSSIDVTDMHRAVPHAFSLSTLTVEAEHLTTLPGHKGTYTLHAETPRHERIEASGTISLDPLHSKGSVSVHNLTSDTLRDVLDDLVPIELRSGTLTITAQYEFDMSKGNVAFHVRNGACSVSELRFGPGTNEAEQAYLTTLEVSNISLDLGQRSLRIGKVSSHAGQISIQRDAQGKTAWYPSQSVTGAVTLESHNGAHDTAWHVEIASIEFKDFGLHFIHLPAYGPVRLTAHLVNLHIADFSSRPGSTFSYTADMEVLDSGVLSVSGSATISPLRVDSTITLSTLPLKPFQPYLETFSRLEIIGGNLTTKATFTYHHTPNGPKATLCGDLSIKDLYTRDRTRQERFVEWNALDATGLSVDLFPTTVRIERAVVNAPFAKVQISKDRRLNLAEAFTIRTLHSTTSKPSSALHTSPVSIEIGSIAVEGGSVYFSDFSLIPYVAAGLQGVRGTINGLSTRASSRARVDITGKVRPVGTVSVYGEINPLGAVAYSDLHVRFEDAELSILSPYSGKFAGYVIKRGKVSLDLAYKVVDRTLVGDNKIVLKQLQLGERTHSPDAVKLPIALAVALLQDVHGNIDIDLPVRGSLDDPTFSLKGIFFTALKNFIIKVVRSPFHVLSTLVGGRPESLSSVSFAPGSAVLSNDEQQKIDTLVQGLLQRPALRLEVCGCYHTEADGQALREAMVEELLAEHLAPYTDSQRAKKELAAVETLFKQYLGKDELRRIASECDQKDHSYRDALKARLAAAQVLPEGGLRALGMARAIAIKDWAVRHGGITDSRIFMLEPCQETVLTNEGSIPSRLSIAVSE